MSLDLTTESPSNMVPMNASNKSIGSKVQARLLARRPVIFYEGKEAELVNIMVNFLKADFTDR